MKIAADQVTMDNTFSVLVSCIVEPQENWCLYSSHYNYTLNVCSFVASVNEKCQFLTCLEHVLL